jgi:methylphosphotriester-DNA--protein-cysteine methyltransferase
MPTCYLEHPLHPALRGVVEAAWSVTLDADAAPTDHRVVADGCMDIVVTPGRAPVVVGPTTEPFFSPMQPGTRVHGLRFRPGAAPFTLGAAAEALRDLEVPLAELFGRRAVPDEPVELVALQQLVLTRLRPTDPLVDAAVARLTSAPGTDVRALAVAVALSERQLRRRFHDAVGYGPKRLARVLRLQRLLAEARRRPGATGVELAFAAGYADEPHMGREARALAGTGAQALLRERGRSVQAQPPGIRDAA